MESKRQHFQRFLVLTFKCKRSQLPGPYLGVRFLEAAQDGKHETIFLKHTFVLGSLEKSKTTDVAVLRSTGKTLTKWANIGVAKCPYFLSYIKKLKTVAIKIELTRHS